MKKFPPVTKLISNLTGTIIRSIKLLINGKQLKVSKEVAQARLSICMNCEYFSANRFRCVECGCFLLKKTKMSSEECPLDPPKW